MSDLNKILAFQNIMPYLTAEKQEELAKTMKMSLEEINKRLVGKNKEDEFLLILFLMDVCKSLSQFDEGTSQLFKTATSDIILELKDGEKFMLEIKHTDKEKYSISGGNLKKRIDYAHKLSLKLYFAISIKGHWMLFDEVYLQSKNGKIDISDSTKSVLDEKIGCVSYMFPKGLRIKSVYSKHKKKSLEIQFQPYGYLKSYELYYGDTKIFRVKGENSEFYGFIILLEALQDRMAMEKQTIKESGEHTIINEELISDGSIISEYKFLLAPLEHMTEDGEKYTAHRYVEKAKENIELTQSRVKVEQIRGIMRYLVDMGIDINYVKNNYIYKLKGLSE